MNVKRSTVLTAPVKDVVFLFTEVIPALKLPSDTTEHDLLHLWIQAATEIIQDRTGLSLITQTREMKLDYFPNCISIELLYGPLQTVTSIKYQDEDDLEQTLDPSEYWVDTQNWKVVAKNNWPSALDRPNAVTIEYTAGFGDDPVDVPYALRSAVLQRVAHLYENRQSVAPINMYVVPEGEDALIGPFIREQYAGY